MLGLVKLALAALLLLGSWLLWSRHGRTPAVDAVTGEEPFGSGDGDRP